jgi:hypothetical protein
MKKFLFIIFVVFLQTVDAQEFNYFVVYHPQINVAERAILDQKYKEALQAYEKAFSAVPRGFMKDYFNAAVCATSIGDASNTYKYLLEVAGKGISIDFIKDEPAFFAIQQDKDWREFEKQYLEKKRAFEAQTNKKLKDHLAKIYERDQWFRLRNPEAFADTIQKVDKQNAIELDYILAKYGFPGEDEIGCGEGGMPVIQYPFYTVIRRQMPEVQTINFSNHLMEAARKGKISPHIATHIMATINGNDVFFARHVFKIMTEPASLFDEKPFGSKINKWVCLKLEPADEQRINLLRSQNGLEPLSDYRKKILFSLQDNRFLFPYKIFAGIWQVSDPNIAADYLNGTMLIETSNP